MSYSVENACIKMYISVDEFVLRKFVIRANFIRFYSSETTKRFRFLSSSALTRERKENCR